MAINDFPSTLFVGQQHIELDRIHSTNTYATDMISKSKPMEGTVISARLQYDGKGQIGRYWQSEEGLNITCSTILCPKFLMAKDQFQLNIAMSLSVCTMISEYLSKKEVWIKWPNDIYVDDLKIAGILIQNNLVGKSIETAIVGTGININQSSFDDSLPNPTSLALELGSEVDLKTSYHQLFSCIEKEYLSLKSGKSMVQKRRYLERLYRMGEWHDYVLADGRRFRGMIAGVAPSGELSIELENGALQYFAFREVQMVL